MDKASSIQRYRIYPNFLRVWLEHRHQMTLRTFTAGPTGTWKTIVSIITHSLPTMATRFLSSSITAEKEQIIWVSRR